MDLQFTAVTQEDFNCLAQIRINAMRESLQNVGQFDEKWLTDTFQSNFLARDTVKVTLANCCIAFYTLEHRSDHLWHRTCVSSEWAW